MKTRLVFLLGFLVIALYGGHVVCRGIVYLYDTDVAPEWAMTLPSYGFYIHEIRDALKRLGYTPIWTHSLSGLQNFDRLVCCSQIGTWAMPALARYPKEKLIAFLWEPPTTCPDTYNTALHNLFSKVYTWNERLVDNVHYFHFYYPRCYPTIDSSILFNAKKLCVMMNCNKDSEHACSLYGERKKLISFFEQNHSDDFDLYGPGWQQCGFKNYRGTVESKIDCIKQYRFCCAYENMCNVQGYITEKIFDPFRAGCVPIYWGADNVTDYIPKDCFIDRREFASDEELYQYLKTMKKDEYQDYINNIKRFLGSAQALVFSFDYYVDIVLEAIEPGYDKTVALTERHRAALTRLYKYLGNN